MHFFGLVQYIGADRTADWVEFYAQIFGFTPLPGRRPLRHPAQGRCCCRARAASFYLQLIEPDDTAQFAPAEEHLQRIGFGVPDVLATVGMLEKRGIEFLASEQGAHQRARRAHQGRSSAA